MKIALVSPPLLPVPPPRYGGVERIVGVLAKGLIDRGHEVTLFAPGDSTFAGAVVATVPESLWNDGFRPDPGEHYRRTVELVLDRASDFDVIHDHLDHFGFDLSTEAPIPTVSTIHGRTDIDPLAGAIRVHPANQLVAISNSQRSLAPQGNWIETIYHGLDFTDVESTPRGGDYLVFVGRLSRDKGVAEAVELARETGMTLRVAAKALDPREKQMYDDVITPAVADGVVEFLGEVDETERDKLIGNALATVMLSNWPEPFGLVAIESLAVGTPVIASNSGALPEIVADGVDGFVVDSATAGAAATARISSLDRARIRQRALQRFSAARMLDDYERLYERVIRGPVHSDP